MQRTDLIDSYNKDRDTSHVENEDIAAMEVESTFKHEETQPVTWTKEEEGRALRKLDWCLIPL